MGGDGGKCLGRYSQVVLGWQNNGRLNRKHRNNYRVRNPLAIFDAVPISGAKRINLFEQVISPDGPHPVVEGTALHGKSGALHYMAAGTQQEFNLVLPVM